jgi:ubiquitin-conjugating enzyme (huntingtin interacting protein 2)
MDPKKRVQKEVAEIGRDSASGVKVSVDPSDGSHLEGTILGPEDTPYHKGTFKVDIVIPNDYPFAPPKMKFVTRMWHPNVSSQTGAICLDILKDQWSPALTIKTALLSLQALMCAPEPSDPQDAEVANMYNRDYDQWFSTAKFWTECYARTKEEMASAGEEVHPSLKRLLDMGFAEDACRQALLDHKGNEDAAIEQVLSSLG